MWNVTLYFSDRKLKIWAFLCEIDARYSARGKVSMRQRINERFCFVICHFNIELKAYKQERFSLRLIEWLW